MLLYEIYRNTLRQYGNNVNKVIAEGYYIPRDDNFIRRAFNFGRGTIEHMDAYMKNNRSLCVWIDPATLQRVNGLLDNAKEA